MERPVKCSWLAAAALVQCGSSLNAFPWVFPSLALLSPPGRKRLIFIDRSTVCTPPGLDGE